MISPDLKLAAGTAMYHSECWLHVWLSVGETYIVHLMAAEDLSLPVDAATHSALQVRDIKKVLARLLEAGEKPYTLSLESLEPRHIQDPHESLRRYTLWHRNTHHENVVEFIDLSWGIFADVSRIAEE